MPALSCRLRTNNFPFIVLVTSFVHHECNNVPFYSGYGIFESILILVASMRHRRAGEKSNFFVCPISAKKDHSNLRGQIPLV